MAASGVCVPCRSIGADIGILAARGRALANWGSIVRSQSQRPRFRGSRVRRVGWVGFAHVEATKPRAVSRSGLRTACPALLPKLRVLGAADHRRQRRESFRGVPHEPFLCDDSDSGFRIVPLVMPRKRRCFRQTFPASAQAIHQEPLIFLLGIFLLERRLMAEMQLGRWGPFCVTARGRFLSSSSPISAFGGAVGWSVF